jgi:hypothetical protein
MLHDYGISDWVESNGGPLLLLASELLPFWSGVRPPGVPESDTGWQYDENTDCDYNRVCRISGYLGLVNVGDGEGLVLGGEPLSTAWCSSANSLVRWIYADSDADVLKALTTLHDALWEPTNLIFKVASSPLYLFNSAYPGNEIQQQSPEPLKVALTPGEYSLFIADYKPDEDTALLLHRFVRE